MRLWRSMRNKLRLLLPLLLLSSGSYLMNNGKMTRNYGGSIASQIQTWISQMSSTAKHVWECWVKRMCCICPTKPHLCPRSEICRTWLMPRPPLWPGWPLWRPAGDGKGLDCPCLLLPKEIKYIIKYSITLYSFKVNSSANVAGNLLLYLRSCDQLSRAGGDLMRTHHQLLKLALALHHLISCITAGRRKKQLYWR